MIEMVVAFTVVMAGFTVLGVISDYLIPALARRKTRRGTRH